MDRETYTITEGVFFELECKLLPNEEYVNSAHMEWDWDHISTDNSLRKITLTSDYNVTQGYLFIKSTKQEDAGRYKCIVKNDNGIDHMVVSLTIRGGHSRFRFIL